MKTGGRGGLWQAACFPSECWRNFMILGALCVVQKYNKPQASGEGAHLSNTQAERMIQDGA